jgi:hypothetical protein
MQRNNKGQFSTKNKKTEMIRVTKEEKNMLRQIRKNKSENKQNLNYIQISEIFKVIDKNRTYHIQQFLKNRPYLENMQIEGHAIRNLAYYMSGQGISQIIIENFQINVYYIR